MYTERIIRIVAGTIVLASVALSHYVSQSVVVAADDLRRSQPLPVGLLPVVPARRYPDLVRRPFLLRRGRPPVGNRRPLTADK